MTCEIDVYAFAISCVEILMKGDVPWGLQEDGEVRQLVLRKYMSHCMRVFHPLTSRQAITLVPSFLG